MPPLGLGAWVCPRHPRCPPGQLTCTPGASLSGVSPVLGPTLQVGSGAVGSGLCPCPPGPTRHATAPGARGAPHSAWVTVRLLSLQVENSYSISVPIFKQFHKNIIGKGGANIKKVAGRTPPKPAPPPALPQHLSQEAVPHRPLSSQIREESNTKIDLPAENSNSETIVITGKRANCEAARSRILSIQKDLVTGRCLAGRGRASRCPGPQPGTEGVGPGGPAGLSGASPSPPPAVLVRHGC